MSKRLKAVYENGVFRPLEPVSLAEHQHVTITIDSNGAPATDDVENGSDATPMPTNGAELVAYWDAKELIGSRPDITDSVTHARALRRQAETRHP